MSSLISWFGFHNGMGTLPLVLLVFGETDLSSVTADNPGSPYRGEAGTGQVNGVLCHSGRGQATPHLSTFSGADLSSHGYS